MKHFVRFLINDVLKKDKLLLLIKKINKIKRLTPKTTPFVKRENNSKNCARVEVYLEELTGLQEKKNVNFSDVSNV